jgi:hypothetical protein
VSAQSLFTPPRAVFQLPALLTLLIPLHLAGAQPSPSRYGSIIGHANKCLDVSGESTVEGAQVHLWDCHARPNQQWQGHPVGVPGRIEGAQGRCLEVSDGSTVNGARVQLGTCNETPAQQWTLTEDGKLKGPGGKCLDVEAGGTANGSRIHLWDCHEVESQRWTVTATSAQMPVPSTADSAFLKTWWHDNAELNRYTPVADTHVRRSGVYDVKVATGAYPQAFHDSFVYMSVPRGGREKWEYSTDDGAEFAKRADLTMSWSSFLYDADVWVQVELKDGSTLSSTGDVVVRPTTLQFEKQLVNDRTLRIRVPYSPKGYRFSVEFNNQLFTAYNGAGDELSTDAAKGPVVHTEPRNALLIFAEPMVSGADAERLVPRVDSGQSIHYPAPGEVSQLHTVTEEVIYFRPGTYFMPWNYHAQLPANVKWVYLAPGAYVKGALQFKKGPQHFKVTGFGVLSGEKYVYEADTANGYRHRASGSSDCHGSCVKLLQFHADFTAQNPPVCSQLSLDLHGITLAEPPYHSFVAYGDCLGMFRMQVAQLKQVGGWYWQTDGVELYKGGSMKNAFIHSNDDVLKLYHDRVRIEDIVVWKGENGPVIQWGWTPRNIHDVKVSNVDVIHNRMRWNNHNTCIINSARHYANTGSTTMGDPDTRVGKLLLENIRSEGENLCAMRLYALSNWSSIHIKNLWLEKLNGLCKDAQASHFQVLSNRYKEPVVIGNERTEGDGLRLENYTVAGERISDSKGNWGHDKPGRLNFDVSLWDHWTAQ